MSTLSTSLPGGTWTLGDLAVTRFGYGAMQLAGPGVMGPPADHDRALAVLREAVDLGIAHIDTSNAYGPRVTNQLIREALHPYPESLHIVTKVGATRDQQGGWPPARQPEDLRRSVHENLETLGLGVLDLYNLAYRHDDKLIDELAEKDVAYVPFFPLGGKPPITRLTNVPGQYS
jgi:aryl-alcohol dehydrogenase-like predicted oxidoreductase